MNYCQRKVNTITDALFYLPQQDDQEKAYFLAKNN